MPTYSILITGASGMLGSALLTSWGERHTICATATRKPVAWPCNVVPFIEFSFESADFSALKAHCAPDVIVNCAAMTDHEACLAEPERAWAVNALAPAKLAEVFPQAYLIQVSSDAGFGGDARSPSENFPAHPDTVYGQTKLEGERLLLKAHKNAVVLRTTLVGLGGRRAKPSLAQWMIDSLEENRPLHLYTDVLFTPVNIWDFTSLLDWCINARPHGTLNACGPEPISKHDFGIKLAQACGLSTSGISPDTLASRQSSVARRLDQSLDSQHLTELRGQPLPSVNACVAGIARRYHESKNYRRF